MIWAVILIAAGYISGAIPTGYWLAKALKGIDIRTVGSGSTGATNVLRCVGKGAGATVFILDILKGYVPVAVAVWMDQGEHAADWTFGYPHLVPCVVAVMSLIGHSKSMFLGFTGGKSAATGLGTLFALQPVGGLLTLITFASMVWLGRIVSVASITATALCAVYFYFLQAPPAYVGYCVVGFIYVTFRHKSNIKRLIAGTEPRIGDKPKDPPPSAGAEAKEAPPAQNMS